MERNPHMTNLQQLLYLTIAIALLAAFLCSSINKYKSRKHRDFTRSLETLLQEKETVKVICPQKNFRCILTNKRIIFEKRGDFTAFPIKSIQRIQGTNEKGNRTTVPANMKTLLIQLDKTYQLKNKGPEFSDLVSEILKMTTKKKK